MKLIIMSAVAATTLLFSSFTWLKDRPVRHIVVFKYKSSATAEQIEEVFGKLTEILREVD